MGEHTPTPWDYCKPAGKWLIYPECAVNSGIDYFIADVRCVDGRHEEAKANAAFIVRACNAHDDLVKALEESLAAMRPAADKALWNGDERLAVTLKEACRRVHAALAKATGES